MLEVRCPNCEKLLQVVEIATENESRCPMCSASFRPSGLGNAPECRIQGESPILCWDSTPDRREFEIPEGRGKTTEAANCVSPIAANAIDNETRALIRVLSLILTFPILGLSFFLLLFCGYPSLSFVANVVIAAIGSLLLGVGAFFTMEGLAIVLYSVAYYLCLALVGPGWRAMKQLRCGFIKAAGRPTNPPVFMQKRPEFDVDTHHEVQQ